MLRSARRSLFAMSQAKGRGVKAEEEEYCVRPNRRKSRSPVAGARRILRKEETPSGMTVWYPRFGEG